MLYEEVRNLIREKVLKGEYKDRLPPERELASLYSVSYMTARKAVQELVAAGLLIRKHGKGTFVRSPDEKNADAKSALALILPKDGEGRGLYYSYIIEGICRKCSQSSAPFVIADRLEQVFSLKKQEAPVSGGLKGVIITPGSCSDREISSVSRFIPVVLLEWHAVKAKYSSVTVDNHAGQSMAIEHLISLGHKEIGYISGRNNKSNPGLPGDARLQGYLSTLEKTGIKTKDKFIQQGDFEFKSGYKAALNLLKLKNRPTAIACGNDLMALGAIRCLTENGVSVPGEISVTGFDNVSAAEYSTPALTTIQVCKVALGENAADILLRGSNSITTMQLPAELVKRSTTAPVKK